jgi:hypothetical protein
MNADIPKETKKEGTWAKPVDRLQVGALPNKAMNLNVSGRRLTGPLRGFGQMWQKTYRIRLSGADVTLQALIKTWKEKFPTFWPEGNKFYGSLTGIQPGDVAVLNLAAPAHMPLSTGVMVIYADDESFTFMTPQGHIFAAFITFSAFEEEGATVAQVQALIRASDPVYEIGCRIGIVHKREDAFWHGTLRNLASYFGVTGGVQQTVTRVDNKVQWAEAKNIWHNAAVRSALYTPVYLTKRVIGR